MRRDVREGAATLEKYRKKVPSLISGFILRDEVKRSFIFIALLTLLYGCAGGMKSVSPEISGPYSVSDISAGLPTDGLWRERVVLYDVNGDGVSDILAPLTRKAEGDEHRPYIFLFDAKEKKWSEAKYSFPSLSYDYGGISVGDINRDGLFDIALATHSGNILILINNGDGSFREMPFPIKEEFHSRAIKIVDINGDGWPDIVAVSEAPFVKDYVPKGLLIAINKEGKGWDTRFVEDSPHIFSDHISVGDINGDGKIDVAIAPQTGIKEDKKPLWLGDGKGGFTNYPFDFAGDMFIDRVGLGDVDGDGLDDIVFILEEVAAKGGIYIKAYKWTPQGLQDISEGLQIFKKPLAFDIADIDGDGKKDIILLEKDGLHIMKYSPSGWTELFRYDIAPKDTVGVKDLRVAHQPDGSIMIVWSLGKEPAEYGKGLRAYLLYPKKRISQ